MFFNELDDFQPEGRSTEGEPIRWDKVESIRHLRHHPKTGVLQYRRVVPPDLRSILGRGSICASLGSKVLNHAALIRWVEIDRDARRRPPNTAHGNDRPGCRAGPAHVVHRHLGRAAAFQVWSNQEPGRDSARVSRFTAHGMHDDGLLAFRQEVEGLRHAVNDSLLVMRPKRGIVERTSSRIGRNRCLVRWAEIRVMLRQWAAKPAAWGRASRIGGETPLEKDSVGSGRESGKRRNVPGGRGQ